MRKSVRINIKTQKLEMKVDGITIKSFPVSTGVLRTPTPVGTFAVYKKVPVVHYKGPGYDLPNTKWNLGFKPSYYLHGAYWHNQFGIRPMSHGCVNIAYKDVEKLYAFMDVGDKVVISGKTPKRVQIASVAL
jgi:lipoprotein-anchoring transpeptidase ErfK/SrfK